MVLFKLSNRFQHWLTHSLKASTGGKEKKRQKKVVVRKTKWKKVNKNTISGGKEKWERKKNKAVYEPGHGREETMTEASVTTRGPWRC